MLLSEIAQNKTGTYAGVRFDDETIDAIQKYILDNNIPNPVKDFHSTLLFSRKQLPNYQPIQYEKPITGTVKELKQMDGGDNIIAIVFDAPELTKRHEDLMKEHGATWDHPSFIPHISLTYDGGDTNLSDLTKPDFPINIIKEYSEQLNL